jgi:hypothetical protein
MSFHRIAEDTLVQTSTGVREIQSLLPRYLESSSAVGSKGAVPYMELCHSFGNTVSKIGMVSNEETTRCVRIVTRSGMTLTCSPDTEVIAIDLRTTTTKFTPLSHIAVHHDLIGVVTNKSPCVPYNFSFVRHLDSPRPFSYADLMNSESEEQGYTVAHNIFWSLRENDNSGPLVINLPSRRYAQAVSTIASQMGCISHITQDNDSFTTHVYPMHKLSLLYRTLWGSKPDKGFNFNTPYPKLHDTVWAHSLHKCVSMHDLTPHPQVCTIIEALEGGRLRSDKLNPFPLLYADPVVCVRETVPRPLYSISSQDSPAFIANGFIVKM